MQIRLFNNLTWKPVAEYCHMQPLNSRKVVTYREVPEEAYDSECAAQQKRESRAQAQGGLDLQEMDRLDDLVEEKTGGGRQGT
jgi:hypothetical protein